MDYRVANAPCNDRTLAITTEKKTSLPTHHELNAKRWNPPHQLSNPRQNNAPSVLTRLFDYFWGNAKSNSPAEAFPASALLGRRGRGGFSRNPITKPPLLPLYKGDRLSVFPFLPEWVI